ncbi:hypothetical protein AB1K84_01175, partial [Mesobacillus foraminis]|uniref:hypothetical protein n=1 Tax=Mesobacillus foraminis TaxID=279826 RepID=UPI0039A2276C
VMKTTLGLNLSGICPHEGYEDHFGLEPLGYRVLMMVMKTTLGLNLSGICPHEGYEDHFGLEPLEYRSS